MTKKTYLLIAAGVAVVGMGFILTLVLAVGLTVYLVKRDQPAPSPAPPPPNVSVITDKLKGNPEDAAVISAIYGSFADVVEKDTKGLIGSTTDLRQANTLIGPLVVQDSLKGKYPGLADLIDRELSNAVGLQRRELDSDLRRKAVVALRSVSDAAKGAVE